MNGVGKIFKKRIILIFGLFLIIFSIGSVAAADESCANDSDILTEYNNTWYTNSSDSVNYTPSTYNETEFEFSENINVSTEELDYLSGCCSVLLHVRDGYDVFAYRRDSTYAANLYITLTSWYGKTAVKEYKTTNSYFFHTIITLDGWMVGIGGADVPGVVQQLERLAGNTAASGKITSSTVSSALSLVSQLGGIGHFVIKAPNNVVGYAIVNGGRRSGLFTMGNGQYLAVPNSPSCYRSGYVSTSSPVATTMSLAYNNPWGVNHRNVIAYEYVQTSDLFNYITKINVYASKSIASDNIIFRGNFISGSSLPTTPSKRYIGQVVKKVSRPTTQFGYENMIETYCEILDTYSTTGALPGSVGVGPWMVTVEDVIEKAVQVKTDIEANHKLPASVTINGLTINMATFLRLLTTSVVQINNNDLTTLLNPQSFGTAPAPKDTMSTGDLEKSDYLAMAQNVKNFMDLKGRAPNFAVNSAFTAYITSLGTNFGYQNMIYTFSKILDTYNKTGTLPDTIDVKPWSIISNPAAKTFTVNEIVSAAINVKDYVEINQQLPSAVSVKGQTIGISTFLELLTTTVLRISNGDLDRLIDCVSFGSAPNPYESINAGNLLKTDYLQIAQNVKEFMNTKGRAPNFAVNSAFTAYITSLGTNFGYQNMIYTYSKILDTYNKTGTLPATIEVKPWRNVVNDPNISIFTIDQVLDAASWVTEYVEINQKLPEFVGVNGINVNIPSFLELLTKTTLKIYNNDKIEIALAKNYKPPTTPQDTQKTGIMTQAKYIEIAGRIDDYMQRNQKAPPYSSYSPLGTYFGYENLIYTYSKILNTYKNTADPQTLPNNVEIVPWSFITNYSGTFTIQQTTAAATWMKNYLESEQKMPEKVPITGTNLQGTIINTELTLPTFLQLLTTTTLKINKNDNTPTDLARNYQNPSTPKDSQRKGTMTQEKYIEIAGRVKNYMDRYLKAPPYSSYSPLGTYFGYENLIYTYCKILDTHNKTGTLPANILIAPWKLITNYSGTFTIQQTTAAATWMKNYIETNNELPEKVPITGTNLQGTIINTELTLPTFLQLLTTATLKINKNDKTPTDLAKNYQTPSSPKDTQKLGTLSLSKYIEIAGRVKDYMDRNLKAPDYSSYSPLGTYFGFQNLIYTYSKIISACHGTGPLPASVGVGPWMVTVGQVASATEQVKTYIDTHHKLPSTATVNGITVSMPTFLKLLTTSVLQINNNDLNTLLSHQDYGSATAPRDTINSGEMPRGTYVDVASRITDYMDRNLKAPNYSSYSNLGTCFGYQNLIYTYSKIMNTYHSSGTLPNSQSVDPWMVTVNDVVTAAKQVKAYFNTNNKLPSTATVNGITVSMPTFLKLLTTSVLQINNNDLNTRLDPKSYGNPPQSKDLMKTRTMTKTEYLYIANNVKNFMNSNGRAPGYATALKG